MNAAVQGANPAAAKNAIAMLAQKCVEALGCAATADEASMKNMAEGFRRYAAKLAEDAWKWVPALRQGGNA